MGHGLRIAVTQMCLLCVWTVQSLPQGSWRQLPRRIVVFGLMVPALILLSIMHWLGFTLDEILFRRYRKVTVRRPIFVSGIPRSGTTHLQRVLATHDKLTCMQTWECFLAPSITERYLCRGFRWFLNPLASVVKRFPMRFLKEMEPIHSLGLSDAEEDFVTLLPINACFLLVVLFPQVDRYWRLSRLDVALPQNERQKVVAYYHRMIQKHLYFHGEELRYLCKNPSFMMWLNSLGQQYPDASFILCERSADKTIPSQLSSLAPSWTLVHGEPMSQTFASRIVTMLAAYYHYLEKIDDLPIHVMRLPMSSLMADLARSIQLCLNHCELEMTEHFQASLQQHLQQARHYQSAHQYGATEIFDWSGLQDQFPRQFLSPQSMGAS